MKAFETFVRALRVAAFLQTRKLLCTLTFITGVAYGGGTVTSPTEENLRAAMAGGGWVTFACDGVITLSATITNLSDTVLDATGHQITISGSNAVRVFYVGPGVAFSGLNLAISNGVAASGAGILNDGGILRLTAVGFFGNKADGRPSEPNPPWGDGGAVLNLGGTVNATNCTFAHNLASQNHGIDVPGLDHAWGGAICNAAGQVTLDHCRFEQNAAQGGPLSGPGGSGTKAFGGAIHNSANLIVEACWFDRNVATGGGATNVAFPNTGGAGAEGAGGAVWNGGTAVLNRSLLLGNSAIGGQGDGGPRGGEGPFGSNGGGGGGGGAARGGAVFNSGSLMLNENVLATNIVHGGPGGSGGTGGSGFIYATSGGPGGAGGAGNGSALFNLGSATMINCTAASNESTGGPGGGGGNGGDGVKAAGPGGNGGGGGDARGVISSTNGLFLTNCTVAANHATSGAGGAGGTGGINSYPPIIRQADGVAGTNGFVVGGLNGRNSSLINSLLASNTPVGNCSGTLTDLGHNLSSDASCAFTNVGSLNNMIPRLGPLADNGGPTLTMALRPGSPAIDAGANASAPPTDQRGVPRPVGFTADIGAYEFTAVLEISRAPGNGINVLVYGPTGQTCRLLTCATLTNWQCIATNQIGADGTVLFPDNCGTGQSQRFYKVALP